MKNRLDRQLNSRGNGKLFCAYVTLGFPSVKFTEDLILALEEAKVDILELGFPFSDPLADGPTIQMASEASLQKGIRLADAFRVMSNVRRRGLKMPVLFFSYLNPILHFGLEAFCCCAKEAGFDGAIIPDLPIEEGRAIEEAFHAQGMGLVYLVAPTTPVERMRKIAERSDGFVYYVSVRGVTGARGELPKDMKHNLRALKRSTDKPVLVGFGVSSPRQARAISSDADGVIVGSAIIDRIAKSRGNVKTVVRYASQIAKAIS